MNLLKTRKGAALVLAVCVVCSTLYGSHRSLMGLYARAQSAFTQGVEGDGFSIENDLGRRAERSLDLATVARRYLPESDRALLGVVEARGALLDSRDPQEKYRANLRLTEAVEVLYGTLGGMELSEADKGYRQRIYADLSSINDIISHDGYNEIARAYNEIRGDFPANLLGGLTGVPTLTLFGV